MLEKLASTKRYKIQETLYLIIDYICRYAWDSENETNESYFLREIRRTI